MGRRNRTFPLALAILPILAACQQPPGAANGPVETQPLGQTLPVKNGDTALGRQAFLSGDLSVAKTAFSAALRKDPSDADAALGLAETHLALNEVQAARQIFQALSTKAPSLSARVNQGLGLIALRSGRSDQAIGLLGKSVQQDDSLWRAWLGLGQAHDRMKQPSAARRAFAAAERVAPARAPVLNDLGMSYVSQKQPHRALEFFERALAMDPGYEIARGNIRIAKAMTGQYEDAISGASQTQLPDVLNNVGYIAILNKDFQVADRYLRRAIDLSAVYHKAAVANLDLLSRMAGDATPSRKTADADIAEEPQIVLAPAASAPDTQTLAGSTEIGTPGLVETQSDAVANAATQQASSDQELAALSTPVVTSLAASGDGDRDKPDSRNTASRQFKWEGRRPSAPDITQSEEVRTTAASERPASAQERTFNWEDQPAEPEIETADITSNAPVTEDSLDRDFNWEDPMAPISAQPKNIEQPGPPEVAVAPEPVEPQPTEARELRAPLLVDGVGTNSPIAVEVITVLPPSEDAQASERRFNWVAPQ